MLLTASTELAPNQWIPDILTKTAQMPGILVLVWITGLMAVGRLFAGFAVHRLAPLGLLISAASFSAAGILLLSGADSKKSAIIAATLFATMLGVTSERFPSGGALLLGMMGAAGNLSVATALPLIGRIYDLHGPKMALREVTFLPLFLIVVFGSIFIYDRSRGGYKQVHLASRND